MLSECLCNYSRWKSAHSSFSSYARCFQLFGQTSAFSGKCIERWKDRWNLAIVMLYAWKLMCTCRASTAGIIRTWYVDMRRSIHGDEIYVIGEDLDEYSSRPETTVQNYVGDNMIQETKSGTVVRNLLRVEDRFQQGLRKWKTATAKVVAWGWKVCPAGSNTDGRFRGWTTPKLFLRTITLLV